MCRRVLVRRVTLTYDCSTSSTSPHKPIACTVPRLICLRRCVRKRANLVQSGGGSACWSTLRRHSTSGLALAILHFHGMNRMMYSLLLQPVRYGSSCVSLWERRSSTCFRRKSRQMIRHSGCTVRDGCQPSDHIYLAQWVRMRAYSNFIGICHDQVSVTSANKTQRSTAMANERMREQLEKTSARRTHRQSCSVLQIQSAVSCDCRRIHRIAESLMIDHSLLIVKGPGRACRHAVSKDDRSEPFTGVRV